MRGKVPGFSCNSELNCGKKEWVQQLFNLKDSCVSQFSTQAPEAPYATVSCVAQLTLPRCDALLCPIHQNFSTLWHQPERDQHWKHSLFLKAGCNQFLALILRSGKREVQNDPCNKPASVLMRVRWLPCQTMLRKKRQRKKNFPGGGQGCTHKVLPNQKKEVCVSISTGGCGCVRQNCPEHCNTSCRAHQELAEGKQGTLTLVDAGIGSRALSRFNPLD